MKWRRRRRAGPASVYVTDGPSQDGWSTYRKLVLPPLDVLPPQASIEVDLKLDISRVRWRGWIDTGENTGEASPWSAWYDLDGLPERIHWADLWAGRTL